MSSYFGKNTSAICLSRALLSSLYWHLLLSGANKDRLYKPSFRDPTTAPFYLSRRWNVFDSSCVSFLFKGAVRRTMFGTDQFKTLDSLGKGMRSVCVLGLSWFTKDSVALTRNYRRPSRMPSSRWLTVSARNLEFFVLRENPVLWSSRSTRVTSLIWYWGDYEKDQYNSYVNWGVRKV